MAERIRVLQVVTRLVVRGVPRHVLDLATHLDPERFEVEVLAGRGEPGEGSLWEEAGVRGVVTHRLESLQREANPFKDALAFACIYRRIRAGRYDVVHTHISKAGILGRFAARLAGVPTVVHTYHGNATELAGSKFTSRLYLHLERHAAQIAHTLVAVSNDVQNCLLAMGVGRKEQYVVIPNGIDVSQYAAGEARERPQPLTGCPIVGTVSSLTPEKGVDVLLRAMSLLVDRFPNLQLYVVGDGPLRSQLEKEAKDLAIDARVYFAGIDNEVQSWLSSTDVFVLPSRSEGMGRVLQEAMACDVAVVASRVGGIPELVQDGITGLLVEPDDPAALAQAIGELLEDDASRRQLADAGRRFVADSYGLLGLVSDIEEIYKQRGTG